MKEALMDDERIRELEERLKNRRPERNYNFFRPVGQIIEYVDTINFSMDKEGNFHFENVGQVNGMPQTNGVPVKDVTKSLPADKEMVDVCELTMKEGLWWAFRSWAVVFRVYQKAGYKGSMTQFVTLAKAWPWTRSITYVPSDDAVSQPLRDGGMMANIDKWRQEGVPERNCKLAERLMELLDIE